jgi:KUP system potassium uptake protein
MSNYKHNKSIILGVIIALGIVYGDIGTSPLYVIKALCAGRILDETLIYGGLSCVFWTLTLQTTIKYVTIMLNIDRKGQGGLLVLYSMIKKGTKWWIVLFAMIGASMLLAEGLVTPAISVSSAVEGLSIIYPEIQTLPIVITILALLFLIQRLGTSFLGVAFGPIMILWFFAIGFVGIYSFSSNLEILKAVNPIYAFNLLVLNPGGFWLLGAIFLCTTGAEALYSDMGHCDKRSIRIGWIFVKICLLLNYFGQGAYLLDHLGQETTHNFNPFYAMAPQWSLIPLIIIATLAAIIASQALITGSFSLVNEASRLGLWPKLSTKYPTTARGQIYIPIVNNFLFIGCIFVTLYFQTSARMEAAYGIAVITTMINSTILVCAYLLSRKKSKFIVIAFAIIYGIIEGAFFIANLAKFFHGGWVVVLFAFLLLFIMWVWHQTKIFKRKYAKYVDLNKIIPSLVKMSTDHSLPKVATHLVYLTSSKYCDQIESKVLYSLMERRPKRANLYWFVHVKIADEPYLCEYKTTVMALQDAIRIDFKLGFRIEPNVNMLFRHVMEDMIKNKEINTEGFNRYQRKQNYMGDISFVVLKKYIANYSHLKFYDRFMISSFEIINKISLPEEKAFGIDDEPDSIIIEKVPVDLRKPIEDISPKRVFD